MAKIGPLTFELSVEHMEESTGGWKPWRISTGSDTTVVQIPTTGSTTTTGIEIQPSTPVTFFPADPVKYEIDWERLVSSPASWPKIEDVDADGLRERRAKLLDDLSVIEAKLAELETEKRPAPEPSDCGRGRFVVDRLGG